MQLISLKQYSIEFGKDNPKLVGSISHLSMLKGHIC